MPSTQHISIFATDQSAEEIHNLIAVALETAKPDGTINMVALGDAGVALGNYSRTWQIARRAWLEVNRPELLVDLAAAKVAHEEEIGRALTPDEYVRRIVSPIVSGLRDGENLSWGEINVRLGVAESFVRKSYKATGGKKDIGLRIGKGGRFVYGDPTLYQDNRKKEGAYIAPDFKGRPTPPDLLNYHSEDEPKAKPVRRSTKKSA